MPDLIKRNYSQIVRNFILSENCLWFIIVLGAVFYSRQYLDNRSLWIDEATVSLDIIQLPVSQFLHQVLPHRQAAGLGFLIIEKMNISLFGTGEYILRLYPFVCGLVSLWLFSRMAKIYLRPKLVILALFVFVITPELVYYASEVKPYITDVFFVLLLYVVIAESCLKELDWEETRKLGMFGAIIIWFSFPVIFVLLGIGITFLLDSVIQRNRPQFLKWGVIFICWLISFIVCYVVLLHYIVEAKGWEKYWQDGYVSLVDINSWKNVFYKILEDPLGISNYLWIAGLFFLAGGYSFLKEDKRKFFLLAAPIFFCFLASGFHKYSCKPKLVLFLVPVLLLMIINGIGVISFKMEKGRMAIAFLLTGILFYGSFFFTCKNFIQPIKIEEIKTVISYAQKNFKQGDVLFAFYGSSSEFKYYHFIRGYFSGNCIIEKWAIDQPQKWRNDLGKLHGLKRVWIVFSNIWFDHIKGKDTKQYFLDYLLNSGGRLLDQSSSTGAWIYLFDLSKFPNNDTQMCSMYQY